MKDYNEYKEHFEGDLKRYKGKNTSKYLKKLHKLFRKTQFAKSALIKKYYRFRYSRQARKHHLEIYPELKIGKGLRLLHAYCITINNDTVIGDNFTISKGATIGQENRGVRDGSPIIGNKVWVGANAAIVGKVTIGDDVLIAPNAYVNCNIPSHSVVFGNPCIIKHKDNATEGYSVRCCE